MTKYRTGPKTYAKVKCTTSVTQRIGRERWKYIILKLLYYHLNLDCSHLKMPVMNNEAATKMTKSGVVVNKSTEEEKCNHKK